MKRPIAAVLTVMIALALTGCSNPNDRLTREGTARLQAQVAKLTDVQVTKATYSVSGTAHSPIIMLAMTTTRTGSEAKSLLMHGLLAVANASVDPAQPDNTPDGVGTVQLTIGDSTVLDARAAGLTTDMPSIAELRDAFGISHG